METPMLSYYMGYLPHHTQVSIIHTHNYFHISMYYTCQHNSMPHPPQEGVTEVWHIAHFWVSYDRCAMAGSPMVQSDGLSWR